MLDLILDWLETIIFFDNKILHIISLLIALILMIFVSPWFVILAMVNILNLML